MAFQKAFLSTDVFCTLGCHFCARLAVHYFAFFFRFWTLKSKPVASFELERLSCEVV